MGPQLLGKALVYYAGMPQADMISVFRRVAHFEPILGRIPGLFPFTRHRLYFFLVFLSWGCFALSIAHMGQVVIEWPAPLGLISYLHWTYWIALGLLILASIAGFIDGSEHSQVFFVTLTLTFGIYIVGLGALVEVNARNPDAYQNFALVRDLLHSGHINYEGPSTVGSYRSWPGAHYILTTLLLSTGLTESAQIFKFLSLAWPFYLTAVTQAIGSRLGLSTKQTFIISLLPLLSTLGWDEYPATFIGQTLYFLSIMILLSPKGTRANLLVLSVITAGITITHAISSAALLLSAIGFWIFGGGSRNAVALTLMLAGIWYLSFARGFVVGFIEDLKNYWVPIFRAYFLASTYKTVGPPLLSRLVLRYSQLFFYVAYFLFGLRHLVWMAFRARKDAAPRMATAVFGALIMLAPLAVLLPLGEGVPRVIILGSVWTMLLLILTGHCKITVLTCLILFPVLLPFARYAGEGMWSFVDGSTLNGAKFFASTVDAPKLPMTFFAHHRVPSLIIYYNPEFYLSVPLEPVWFEVPSVLGFDVSRLSSKYVSYVIMDKQGHDTTLWSFGYDPFEKWPATTTRTVNKIYDNGNFQVYQNVKSAALVTK